MSIWLAWYGVGLAALVLIAFGDVLFAPLLIVITEFIFIQMRRPPKLSASTYAPTTTAQWQGPITALTWPDYSTYNVAIVSAARSITDELFHVHSVHSLMCIQHSLS